MDTHSTSRVLVAIVKLCFEANNYNCLNEQIVNLTKRRSQNKLAVTKMIDQCCIYVDLIKDKETQLKYIETLRTVTAGKIYVEVERARLTLKLAHMKEADGKIEKDYVRTQIISKKVQTKYFNEPGMEELKFKYYNLMIELDKNEDAYLNIFKHYMAIYNTPSIKEDSKKRCSILKNCVGYIILAPYDNEQSDLINRLKLDKFMSDIPDYLEILKLFTTWELINWNQWEASVSQLLKNGKETIEFEADPTGIFGFNEKGNARWNDLKNRVVEHVSFITS